MTTEELINMAVDVDTDKYYFERQQLLDDDDSEYQYEQVPVDDVFSQQDIEDDLEAAVKAIHETARDAETASKREDVFKPSIVCRPEVADDFVRNFLVRMNMHRTLDSFETEWYEAREKGLISSQGAELVPDIYTQNQSLEQDVQHLRKEAEKFRLAALKAKDTFVQLRKERDYHRMHHKRVVQEKNRLITDLRRLREHFTTYAPALEALTKKYKMAMKEKMLSKLERDRVVGEVEGLRRALKTVEETRAGQDGCSTQQRGVPNSGSHAADKLGVTQRKLAAERAKLEAADAKKIEPRHPNDAKFPEDLGINPQLALVKKNLPQSRNFRQFNSFKAHSHAVSSLALHPRKQILATTSDDMTWKVWALPSGELILNGRGHTDWVAGCDFHPSGVQLATVSGDSTVKIWDFANAKCIHTFTDHQKPVWGCSWHNCGEFLATCSMDNTGKVFDLRSFRCRYTLRGHTESVNAIQFLPYSNTLLTCSADKTVSLWDARTGLCAQTFYGHHHSVNSSTFNLRGDTIASCDSYGVVKFWDVRTVSAMTTLKCGPHAANMVAFDPSGSLLAVASNDGSVKINQVSTTKISSLIGHEDAVQCILFERGGEFLVSGGSDLMVRVWS